MSDSFHRAKYRRLPLLDRLRRGGGEARRNELEAAEAIEKRDALIRELVEAVRAYEFRPVDRARNAPLIARAHKILEESP